MKKRKTLILMLSLVCLLVVGIGFAAITKDLSISGSVNLTPDTSAFNVEFTSATGGQTGDSVKITDGDTHQAEISVTSLKKANDTATFTLVITNSSSKNMAAKITDLSVTGDGTTEGDAFTVAVTGIANDQVIEQTKTATITVTVTLNITPVEDVSGSFTVEFTAEAVLAAQA